MNDFINSLPRHHPATDKKVPSANEVLMAHADYHKIEGTLFVHGTIDPVSGRTSLNYSTPDDFTEDQIQLADKIIQSLTF